MWQRFRKSIILVDVAQKSPQWYAERSLRLSGSVLEQAKGLSKFGGPDDVFKVKPVNHHMERGVLNEPLLRDWYSKTTGWKVEEPAVMLTTHTWNHCLFDGTMLSEKYGCQSQNSYHPNWFLIGSPDGLVKVDSLAKTNNEGKIDKDDRLLEIKSPAKLPWSLKAHLENPQVIYRSSPTNFPDLLTQGIKSSKGALDHYGHIYRSHYWQMQFYMGLAGLSSADYLVGGSEGEGGAEGGFGYLETIPFNEEYWTGYLYPECVYFVEKYIHPLLTTEEGKQRLADNDKLRKSINKSWFTSS